MTGSTAAAAGDVHKLDNELTSLLTRINPAYAAVRNLDQGTDLLHRGLASGLITSQQYNSSISLLEASFAKANRATGESAFMTARAKQEMVVLGRELAAGNFSRMPGTLSIIAQGLSPVAWGIAGITAVLAAGGYAWWKWGEDARAATEAARKGLDDAKAAADRAQQLTQMERLADISEKIGKLEKEKTDLAEKSRKMGLAGQGGKGELWAYESQIAEKQREITGLQRQAKSLWDDIEKDEERADKIKNKFRGDKSIGAGVGPEGGSLADILSEERRKSRNEMLKDDERTATETAKKIADAQEKEAKRAAQSWERFTENVQRNLGDVLYNQLNGKFLDIEDLFKQMLFRMAADAAAANLTQSLFGGMSGFPSLGTLLGMNGGMVDPVTGMADAGPVAYGGSFAGGGFTGSGARSGGVDGKGGFPAILHPNETVIDHSEGQKGGITITYAPSFNIDARTDIAQVQQIADAASRRGSADLVDKLQRAGAL
jgi:hypothetical protein